MYNFFLFFTECQNSPTRIFHVSCHINSITKIIRGCGVCRSTSSGGKNDETQHGPN